MIRARTVCILLLPKVHLMDLSGPVQVFYEASSLGPTPYHLIYCAAHKELKSEQGLVFSNLSHFNSMALTPDDFILVPGVDFKSFTEGKLDEEIRLVRPWLKNQLANGIQVASICSGALILAAAGVLDRKKCTSHWKCIDYIKRNYPRIQVQIDKLYVQDGAIYSSAGMSSGIDMALSILEQHHGPVLPAKVAREMVVYLRRNNTDSQQTIYLDYRTHFNPFIHKVQDYIISNPSKNPSLEELASISNVSVRSLTRAFRKTTGHTIIEFKNAVKVELARTLLHNGDLTMEKISNLCGFESARHFRRIWRTQNGKTLREYKNSQ